MCGEGMSEIVTVLSHSFCSFLIILGCCKNLSAFLLLEINLLVVGNDVVSGSHNIDYTSVHCLKRKLFKKNLTSDFKGYFNGYIINYSIWHNHFCEKENVMTNFILLALLKL